MALNFKYLQAVNRAREHRRVRPLGEAVDASEYYFEVPIGELSAQSEALGQVAGYFVASGNHQLVLVYENAVLTPVACEVTVLYKQAASVKIDRGTMSLTRA